MGIKSILDAMFRRKAPVSPIGHNGGPSLEPKANLVAILVPEGYPPELLVRVPARQPRAPSRKGKRRTKEEAAADYKAWLDGTMQQARLRFNFDRDRAESAGATHYIWRSAGDYDVCDICKARNGKRFSLRAPADFQHPGFMMCECMPDDEEEDPDTRPNPCRCFCQMVFPG